MAPTALAFIRYASPKFGFPRLRHLSIHYYFIAGDRWAVDYGQIAPLLEASPNLEYLSLPTLDRFWEHQEEKVLGMKSVKTLDLGESSSGFYLVTSMITSCESLRSFKLHWGRSNGYDESYEDWSIVGVWDALVRVRGTIQEIIFESVVAIPLGSSTANSVSSLSEFSESRILKVNGRSFEGMFQSWILKTGSSDMDEFVAQLLPSGIRSLTIWAPSHVLIPALLALARGKSRGLYEDLTAVETGASTVFQDWLPRPEWSRNEAELRREFTRAGALLKINIPYVPPESLNIATIMGGFIM